MNLGDLLVELRQGLLNDRTDRVSGTSDYLWPDTRLTLYINEAQRRFAVRGLVIHDSSTPEVCQVTLVTAQDQYTLHPAILGVKSAKVATNQADLRRVGHAFLGLYRPPSEQWLDSSGFTGLAPGMPVAYSTDEEVGLDDYDRRSAVKLRVYPVPDTAANGTVLQLRVVRRPLDALASSSDEPEIPDDHHLEMLDYAAYLALRVVDDDEGAPARAQEFRASFEAHIEEARQEVLRKLAPPIMWGFGRYGFSWEH